VAHGKTLEEIRLLIQSDELIFQNLDDLKDACIEAASSESGVKDFEVGVFLGQYKTEIPDGYLEDLNSRHPEGKKRKNAFTVDDQDETRGRKSVMVASSSPVNVAGTQKVVDERPKDPERQEDVRYVI